ncbi:MAG: hypothetical protein SV375_05725 [Thermodesulfobacteriota bacterium]|nr:hypothetical protein [Thermodesulfobacteriota bacterium]
MSKKKKPKKKRLLRSSLSPEDEDLLTFLLKNLKKINSQNIHDTIPGPEFAQALIERLSPDNSDSIKVILSVKGAFQDKNVQKAIKKTIFRFKQRGVSLPDLEPQPPPPILIIKAEKVEPSAHLGPVDGGGSRGILVVLPQVPKGVDVGMGVVNDESGILQFLYGRYSKKRMKEIKDLFLSNFQYVVETSIFHAGTILERAYGQSKQGLEESSSSYLKLRPWILENIPLLECAAIYDFIPAESISMEILTDSEIDRLLDHNLMKSWIIDEEKMNPLIKEIKKAEESPILVSEAQRTNRIKEIKKKCIAELYPESKRHIQKDRLEEMAYVFFKHDEEDYARLSVACAVSMDEKNSLIRVNPFLEGMVERSLDYYRKTRKELAESKGMEEDSSGLILSP